MGARIFKFRRIRLKIVTRGVLGSLITDPRSKCIILVLYLSRDELIIAIKHLRIDYNNVIVFRNL